MSRRLTPWFATGTKPVRAGVYQTRIPLIGGSTPGYSRWDGHQWRNERRSVAFAERDSDRGYQEKEWRGLTTEPKASKP